MLVVIGNLQQSFENIGRETFRLYPWSILAVILYFPLGIYLGIPGLVKEYKKNGRWKFNWVKIIFIILPLLYFSFFWFIPTSYPIPDFMVGSHSTFKLAMIASGIVFMNSITKQNSG
ncbi:hypothetical protein [Mesobacillus selenatarsenatis]|uniref:Uncharacterized protein n=1 Tax=Mesobacillus selenatarsenatis (strain DSM 18680 / JCM 14380 / FERM P-15431 / SF-1) TaxID=1321606 RepID=A0A0A8X8M5_MESS1|nr:hypothetical protein [Mesobacillus selenatarsenatis]GAM14486.1 hypothetical protein SAMD00020551_2637 [Mesobacillus selenatarsenatis SF-1]